MTMSDDDREFQRIVNEGMVPRLRESAVAVCISSGDSDIDARFAVQLGCMILMDKPIVVVQPPGTTLSKKLQLVADKIVHADITTPAGHAAFMEALADFGIMTEENP